MNVKVPVGDVEYSLGPVANSIGFLTRVVQIQINDRLRAAGGLPVSPATYSALRLLQVNPGIRQAHAARILMIQESNMANLVKDLIAQELIVRREARGKRGGLWITPKGEEELARGEWAIGADRAYASVLSDKEYRQLLRLLDRIYRAALMA